MGQAADCTPSKIIEFWEVLSFVVVRKCRTFAEAFAWGQGNVDNGNISHQKDWKEKKYRLLTPQNRLKSIKSLNLHPLECTLKGLWHISDLLRTKYWVITGCKYVIGLQNLPCSSIAIGHGFKLYKWFVGLLLACSLPMRWWATDIERIVISDSSFHGFLFFFTTEDTEFHGVFLFSFSCHPERSEDELLSQKRNISST